MPIPPPPPPLAYHPRPKYDPGNDAPGRLSTNEDPDTSRIHSPPLRSPPGLRTTALENVAAVGAATMRSPFTPSTAASRDIEANQRSTRGARKTLVTSRTKEAKIGWGRRKPGKWEIAAVALLGLGVLVLGVWGILTWSEKKGEK